MTMEEVIENELKCVQRDCCRLENECAKCDLVLPLEEIINAYNEALRLKKENLYYKDIVETNSAEWEEQGQRVVALEKENAELRAKVTALENANRAMVKELDDMASNGLNILENVVTNKEQLTKAKELLEKLLLVSCNSEVLNQYPNCSKVLQARVEAEQFLNSEVEK